MSLATELRQALEALGGFAKRDLDRILGLLDADIAAAQDGDDRAKARVAEALHDLLPGLADRYQLAAASLAADLYDEDRERLGIPGSFQADPVDVPDGGHALAGWALETAKTVGGLGALINGGLTKRIMQAGNQTVMEAAIGDPQAGGWQRQARGSGCYFCRMLAGRGAVYSEATVDFSAHDSCHCVAVSAWEGMALPVKPFRPSSRNVTKADRARVNRWIEDHPDELGNVPIPGRLNINGQKVKQHELDSARRLADLGHEVKLLPRRTGHRQTSADLQLDRDKIWEMKSPTGSGDRVITRNFEKAATQSRRIVFDLTDVRREQAAALQDLDRMFEAYPDVLEVQAILERDGRVERLRSWRR